MIQQGLPLVKQDLSPPITGWLVTWLLFFIVSGTIHTLKNVRQSQGLCVQCQAKPGFVYSMSGKARVCVFNVRQSQGLCVQWCTSDKTSWHFCSPLKWCRSHPEIRKKLYLVFFMLELHVTHCRSELLKKIHTKQTNYRRNWATHNSTWRIYHIVMYNILPTHWFLIE